MQEGVAPPNYEAHIGASGAIQHQLDYSYSLSTEAFDDSVDWPAVAYAVGVFVTGAIIVFGIAGNVLTCCILIRTGRRTSMYCIMTALCVSDTIILIANLAFQILPNLHDRFSLFYVFYYIYGVLAVISWPISFAAQMATIWLTVLISAERWVAVCKPLLTNKYCSHKRTRWICYWVFAISFIYSSPRFFEYTLCARLSPDYYDALAQNAAGNSGRSNESVFVPERDGVPYCRGENGNGTGYFLEKNPALGTGYSVAYCAILYFLIDFLIPIVLIGVLNVNLIAELQRSKASWGKLSRNQKKERSITKLPIGIVVLFLVCGAPALAVNVLDAAAIHLGNHWDLMVTIGNLLIMVNSSTNFIIYCLVGKDFRRALVDFFSICKRTQQSATSYSLYSANGIPTVDPDCIDSDAGIRLEGNVRCTKTKGIKFST